MEPKYKIKNIIYTLVHCYVFLPNNGIWWYDKYVELPSEAEKLCGYLE